LAFCSFRQLRSPKINLNYDGFSAEVSGRHFCVNSRSEKKKKSHFISSIRSKEPPSCGRPIVEGEDMARGRFGIFSLLFLFLFCDDVGGLSRDIIRHRAGDKGVVKAEQADREISYYS
jgi:hypothetical protein